MLLPMVYSLTKSHGDWHSDAYQVYLDFSLADRLATTQKMMCEVFGGFLFGKAIGFMPEPGLQNKFHRLYSHSKKSVQNEEK